MSKEFAEMLDKLMGPNRNGDRPNAIPSEFSDDRVCKHFLCGVCPHELFTNTKMDLGPCTKHHSVELRNSYIEFKQKKGVNYYGYEAELYRVLDDLILECDRKIQRAQKRLEETEGAAAPVLNIMQITKEQDREVDELNREITRLADEAEKLGEEGDVDGSMSLMQKVEELKIKKTQVQNRVIQDVMRKPDPVPVPAPVLIVPTDPDKPETIATSVTNQKLRVCDICGAFLSILDSDKRLADHFGGKLHLGYFQIRELVKTMREDGSHLRQWRPPAGQERDDRDGKDRDQDRDRRRRSSSRERERDRDRRDRDKDRDRDRDRDYRDRDRDRDRRDRDRDRDRDRRR
eukprot:TRINITY_DN3225_c0_g1::TRINITY_DN3225_c0_g1_i1::g.29754::m.29754 TRINITY_DN3225_c0_g1::TRINITY_DN3225_c0_g1_i1::g.29754  ORF type:complete len:346 (-),score=34.76,sp/Q9NQ29/LUC7L_HUMAN/38.82/1e-46,LUC7/PF03194.10/1.2e-73,Laminin_II/PF06009.7/0.17,SlyX/PF04102.7/5.2e+02,SlyX/PF04102.7/2.3,SlyX/PF04102.7/7.5e+03,Med9/PF07544.8/0.2,Med9/PF07544.8/2.9e+03 TRINITY_DN3225_c0_g1_i1:285-1322(-)